MSRGSQQLSAAAVGQGLRDPITLTSVRSRLPSLTASPSQNLPTTAFMWPAPCFVNLVTSQDARLVIVNVARNGGHSALDLTWTWLQQNHSALLAKLGGEVAP